MRRGMEATSQWHCSGVMEAKVALITAFRSSAMLGLVSLIFLLTRFYAFYASSSQDEEVQVRQVQVRQVCWPIKHSNTMVIEPAFGTFGSVGRCQVHKACQQKEA